MKVFITGTDTNIGKTVVSSWLCLQTGHPYFKPVQSGSIEGTDSETVKALSHTHVYEEAYCFKAPLSPHEAARLEGQVIDINKIHVPNVPDLIIEGAGGLMVPLNPDHLVIDLIEQINVPVILVASTRLGTINHTLLSLEALWSRDIETLGVILAGPSIPHTRDAITYYGHVKILAELPHFDDVNEESLKAFPLSEELKRILS